MQNTAGSYLRQIQVNCNAGKCLNICSTLPVIHMPDNLYDKYIKQFNIKKIFELFNINKKCNEITINHGYREDKIKQITSMQYELNGHRVFVSVLNDIISEEMTGTVYITRADE